MTDRTILLVEDNPDDVELTLRAFAKSRLANPVVVAHDGEEAVQRLFGGHPDGAAPVRPVLILLDLKLPKLDGIQVLQRIRQDPATRLLPVVILTTSKEEIDLTRCYELGANSYLVKPVGFAEFMEAVEVLQMYWLVLNQNPPAHK